MLIPLMMNLEMFGGEQPPAPPAPEPSFQMAHGPARWRKPEPEFMRHEDEEAIAIILVSELIH